MQYAGIAKEINVKGRAQTSSVAKLTLLIMDNLIEKTPSVNLVAPHAIKANAATGVMLELADIL